MAPNSMGVRVEFDSHKIIYRASTVARITVLVLQIDAFCEIR